VSGVHISDLTALYGLLIWKILKKEIIPSAKEGYYFALAHHLYWWEVMDHLASALKARNLLTHTKVETWLSDDAAAEAMGVPAQFVKPLWNDG
jgi:3-methyladenine DNA glycosylase AlkD